MLKEKVTTLFEPEETQGLITPFMILYALHDALHVTGACSILNGRGLARRRHISHPARAGRSLVRWTLDRTRDADASKVAEAIARVVDMPFCKRLFRVQSTANLSLRQSASSPRGVLGNGPLGDAALCERFRCCAALMCPLLRDDQACHGLDPHSCY